MNQQEIKDKTKIETKIYHILTLVTLSCLFASERIDSKNSFITNAIILSFFSYYINIFYYYIAFISDLQFTKSLSKESLNQLLNFCFNISFTASLIYWSMYSMDNWNNLEKYPPVLNFFLHGGIFILNVLELLYFNPRKSKTILDFKYIICFMGIYPISLKLVYTFTDYSIDSFNKYNSIQFILVCLFADILFILAHYIYKFLTEYAENREFVENDIINQV
jgi:hypothetical protein